MKSESQRQEVPSRTIEPAQNSSEGASFVDNRDTAQLRLISTIQRIGSGEDVNKQSDGGIIQRVAHVYHRNLIPAKDPAKIAFHAQIGFDKVHEFKRLIHVYQPGEAARLKNAFTTNTVSDVGFGAKGGAGGRVITGDTGELFTYYNGIEAAGGTRDRIISRTDREDSILINIINTIPLKEYKIHGYNCKEWVKEVESLFNDQMNSGTGTAATEDHEIKEMWDETPNGNRNINRRSLIAVNPSDSVQLPYAPSTQTRPDNTGRPKPIDLSQHPEFGTALWGGGQGATMPQSAAAPPRGDADREQRTTAPTPEPQSIDSLIEGLDWGVQGATVPQSTRPMPPSAAASPQPNAALIDISSSGYTPDKGGFFGRGRR